LNINIPKEAIFTGLYNPMYLAQYQHAWARFGRRQAAFLCLSEYLNLDEFSLSGMVKSHPL